MREREQKLWDRISQNMSPYHYPLLRLERIESAGINDGLPDVHSIIRGRTTWLELKAIMEFPTRQYSPVLTEAKGLSVDQKNWHLSYSRAGGRVATLLSVGFGPESGYDYFIIDGRKSDMVNTMSRALLEKEAIVHARNKLFWPLFYEWLMIG